MSSSNAGPTPRPNKQLVSYGRLHNVTVGSTQQLAFSVGLESLMLADSTGNLNIYPGSYTLALDVDSKITFSFTLTGSQAVVETFPQRPPNQIAFEELGCYASGTGSSSILSGTQPNVGTSNAPQLCVDQCTQLGYLYAGVMTRYVTQAIIFDGQEC
jgi:beta-D-xylosidase 4